MVASKGNRVTTSSPRGGVRDLGFLHLPSAVPAGTATMYPGHRARHSEVHRTKPQGLQVGRPLNREEGQWRARTRWETAGRGWEDLAFGGS